MQLPINKDDSDCFKDDSSVDSGTETSRSIYPESQKESLIVPKKVNQLLIFNVSTIICLLNHNNLNSFSIFYQIIKKMMCILI